MDKVQIYNYAWENAQSEKKKTQKTQEPDNNIIMQDIIMSDWSEISFIGGENK